MSMNELIERLDSAVARAQGSTGARRKALLPYVLSQGAKLAAERDALEARLEIGHRWLAERHERPESEVERWLSLLLDYEAASDALTRAEGVLL